MIGHTATFVGMFVAELPYLLGMAILYVVIYGATVSCHVTHYCCNNHHFSHQPRQMDCFTKGRPVDKCSKLLLVPAFLLPSHGVLLLFCPVLYVPGQRREDCWSAAGRVDWSKFVLCR